MIAKKKKTVIANKTKQKIPVIANKKFQWLQAKKEKSTRMGFEPMRAEHNGLAVHRLYHSATLSFSKLVGFSMGSKIQSLKIFIKRSINPCVLGGYTDSGIAICRCSLLAGEKE